MDAGFTHVVEIGQYFMTKDTKNSSLRELVVNTLFQEMMNCHNQKMDSGKHKNWIRIGNQDKLSVR